MIQCSDNSSYLGDILVGADGAYSAVRQSLYRQLNEKKELPFKDTQGLKIGYMTMVGTTEPLEEDAYEELKDDFTRFNFVIGKGKPYTVSFSFSLSFCFVLFVCVADESQCCYCCCRRGCKQTHQSFVCSTPILSFLPLLLKNQNSGAHSQCLARESAGASRFSSPPPRPTTWPSGTPNGVLNPTRT